MKNQSIGSRHNPGSKVEILIAEDSPTQLAQLRYLLEENGYAVRAAGDGAQALAMARQQRPALIISDIVMPELDGYGLCKAIKKDAALIDIPVILVTTLSNSQDVIRGLECGADNFIRKPYDGRYLLARVEYLLMNVVLRKNQKMQMGVEIDLGGHKYFITAERQQILDLLISTYEQAILINEDIQAREKELAHSNLVLGGLYRMAEGLNRATCEQEVAELALERALELPGVQAAWISLREGVSGFRLIATRNLPPGLAVSGLLESNCACHRKLLGGNPGSAASIVKCEQLGKISDISGQDYHATIPLWLGGRALGVMNLIGPDNSSFGEEELKMLNNVGNQVAVALERARLHEHLEQLVMQRTADLTAEIAERIVIQKDQARLAAIIEATPDFVATANLDGQPIFTNQAGWQMIDREPAAGPHGEIYQIHPEWAAKLVREEALPYAIEHGAWSGETALLRRDGQVIPVSQVVIAHRGADGGIESISTIARDISVLKEHERRIMRLNRVYVMLSGINTTIVRTRNRQELFNAACRIAIEDGQFRMAWIGMLDPSGAEVKPVAKAGHDDGYINQLNLTCNENAADTCLLMARAIWEKKVVICNDIATDPQMERWRDQAMLRDYRSVVVFPLHLGEDVVGVLVLYAGEKDFFDTEEMRLLTEIAGDISFALDHLEKEERLNYLAYYDVLTGLSNRTLFFDHLNLFLHVAAESNAIVGVLVIDLERFRIINETLGRHVGDVLLKLVAERLCAAGLDTHHLARISTDRFAVVLDHLTKEAEIAQYLEKNIMQVINRPFTVDGSELQISAKAGIAVYPGDGGDADTLFGNAEAALKKAKLSGDKYLFYTPEINAQVAEKLTLENKLRRALERQQFVLHYQPKVNLKSGQIVGVEALIRWNDPSTGLVAPGMFIPLLEETGMILDVGRWALQKSMADVAGWLSQGLASPRVAVNVSPIQLRQKDFVRIVEIELGNTLNGAQYLELELTESLIMQDIDANIRKLRIIREMGATVAIDDFGTGYSSLSYIAKLPVNSLKVDREFIINMASNPSDMSIVAAIVSLAHSLGLKVVAEGVETQEQANLLRLLKCDEIQGYLFSPAVSSEQISVFLAAKKSMPP
jgi:diguanylate cyclase (GGDEF)-like protein/PAS domain S-box-containing protein